MKLRPHRYHQVRDALLDAFDRHTFASFLRAHFGETLEHISQGPNFKVDVERTIRWSETEDQIDAFIHAAATEKPANQQLHKIVNSLDPSWFVATGPRGNNRIFEVDFPQNSNFIGRRRELESLNQLLQAPAHRDSCVVALSGMGGIGKTQLGVEYVYRHSDLYGDGIVWFDANDPNRSVRQQLLDVARLLQLSVADPQRPDIEEQLVAALHDYLMANRDALLVYDNVVDPGTFCRTQVGAGQTPVTLGGRILFITRRQDLPAFATSLRLREIEADTARRIVTMSRPELLRDPDLDTLCAMLDYLPLALRLAAAALGANPDAGIREYMLALEEFGPDTLHRAVDVSLPDYYTSSLAPALKAQLATVADNESAGYLFRLIGQLPATTPIPLARLALFSGITDDGWIKSLSKAIVLLEHASLVERVDDQRLRMQTLVKEYACDQLDATEARQLRAECARRMLLVYEDATQLEAHCFSRGFLAVERDLVALKSLLELDVSIDVEADRLNQREGRLWRLLQREAHTLMPAIKSGDHIRFRQQLYLRARLSGFAPLAESVLEKLRSEANARWEVRWVAQCEADGLERILVGHSRNVNDVALFSGDKRAISAGADKTLRIWDLSTGMLLYTLYYEKSRFFAVMVVDDHVAIGGMADGSITVWDLETQALECTWQAHDRAVTALAYREEERSLLTASADETIKAWRLRDGALLYTLRGHTGWVRDMTTTPDGRRAVSAGSDKRLIVWDLVNRAMVTQVELHRKEVLCVAIAPDGALVASGSADKTICVWELANVGEPRRLIGHRDWVNAVAFDEDGRSLISASGDRTIKIWDVMSAKVRQTLRGHDYRVKAIALFKEGSRLLSGSADNTVRIWQFDQPDGEQGVDGHRGAVHALVTNEAGTRLFTAGVDGKVKAWESATGRLIRTYAGPGKPIHALAYDEMRGTIAAGCADRAIYVWDAASGTLLHTLRGHGGSVESITVTDSGELISGGADQRVIVWENLTTGTHRDYHLHSDWVNDLVQFDDGVIASASGDNTIQVWQCETGEIVASLLGHERWVLAVDTAMRGRTIVSSSNDRTIRVWDVATQAERLCLTGHRTRIPCIRTFADGQRAISASADNSLRVWGLDSGVELARLDLDGEMYTVAVAAEPDEMANLVFTGDVTGRIYALQYSEAQVDDTRYSESRPSSPTYRS